MSVAIDGPKGYEIQYLVTVWIALLAELASPKNASVKVETGEDAEITITAGELTQSIAVQVKNQQRHLDLETFAEWLTHFASHSASETLLKRLIENNHLIVLFVTQARCGDSSRGFIKPPGSWEAHNELPLKAESLAVLATKMRAVNGNSTTKLQKDRAKERERLATQLEKNDVGNALNQIVVWEQITEDRIKGALIQLLTEFRIPASQAASVILELLETVKVARDNRGELMPAFRKVLRARIADRMLPESYYTSRPDDVVLSENLDRQRVLWLTGRSLSGKTHTARVIAQALQDSGTECLETDDLKAARTFLAPGVLNSRFVLLDDPLVLAASPTKTWEAIAHFAQSLPPQHFLVVTAKSEHLLEIDSTFTAGRPDMFGNTWIDLTVTNRDFLSRYWADLTKSRNLPPEISAQIAAFLAESESDGLLQPGQLRFLAYAPLPELIGQSSESLVRLARFNASQIATALMDNQDFRNAILGLAVGGSTKSGIVSRELAFLESNVTERPANPASDIFDDIITFSPGAREPVPPPDFPGYEQSPTLLPATAAILRQLEQRGFIHFSNNRYRFSHPDYQEAFQQCAFRQPISGIADVLAIVERAFSAIDPAVGISAARFIGIWMKYLPLDEKHNWGQIVGVALNALKNSIFPTVRSEIMLSLLRHVNLLNEDEEEKLLRTTKAFAHSPPNLMWHQNTAWLPKMERDIFETLTREKRTLEPTAIETAIGLLRDSKTATEVTGPQADGVNTAYLKRSGSLPEASVLRALLNREEVFIRCDAADIAMASDCAEDAALRRQIFEDEHPMVLARAILATFQNWRNYSEDAKVDLASRILVALEYPGVAVISSVWLFDLGDQYSDYHETQWGPWTDEQKRELWSLWAKSISVALNTLGPRRMWTKSGDLFLSMRAAAEWLNPDDACAVADAWLSWIEEQLKQRPLDDYATSVAEFLLKTTRDKPTVRSRLVARVLSNPETEMVALNLGDLIDEWLVLTGEERRMIWSLIRSQREDVNWLRSIVLTRETPPAELVGLITGVTNWFELPIAERTASIPPVILGNCLHLLTQPVGYGMELSVSNGARVFWRTLIDFHLSEPWSPYFELSLGHFLSRASSNAKQNPSFVARWSALCSSATEETRKIAFRGLLNQSLAFHYSQLGPLWKVFFSAKMESEERNQYLTEIVDNLEGLSYSHNETAELVELLGREVFEEVLKKSPSDELAFQALGLIRQEPKSADLLERIIEIVENVYTMEPPRILGLHSRLSAWMKGLKSEAAARLSERIGAAQESGIEKAASQSAARRPFELQLRNWKVQSHGQADGHA